MRPTVLIVDDHQAFRDSASALLEAEGFSVVGHAADGREALTEAERLRPDVVLVDIQLPDVDGFLVAEQLSAAAGCAECRADLEPRIRRLRGTAVRRSRARVHHQA